MLKTLNLQFNWNSHVFTAQSEEKIANGSSNESDTDTDAQLLTLINERKLALKNKSSDSIFNTRMVWGVKMDVETDADVSDIE